MARTTISLPDDLSEVVRQATDLNVSAVCRAALEAEVARRARVQAFVEKTSEVEINMLNATGTIVDVVHFVGRLLATHVADAGLSVERTYTSYLTGRGRFAFVTHTASTYEPPSGGVLAYTMLRPSHGVASTLVHFDTLEEAKSSGLPHRLIFDTNKALGVNIARRLDI